MKYFTIVCLSLLFASCGNPAITNLSGKLSNLTVNKNLVSFQMNNATYNVTATSDQIKDLSEYQKNQTSVNLRLNGSVVESVQSETYSVVMGIFIILLIPLGLIGGSGLLGFKPLTYVNKNFLPFRN